MDAVVVYCHPDSASYCSHLRTAVVDGLTRGGHRVEQVDLYAEGFDPVMSGDEHRTYMANEPTSDSTLLRHVELVQHADILVFVFPTWWGTMPAMLKGWLERVLRPGVAFTLDDRNRVQPGLTRVRRIVGVSTYGSPRWYFRIVNDGGRRVVRRSLRAATSLRARTTWLGLYGIEGTTNNERAQFLSDVEQQMAQL